MCQRYSSPCNDRIAPSVLPVLAFLLCGIGVSTACAQHYAAPGGGGLAPCTDPDAPCSLAVAMEAATAGPGRTLFIRLTSADNPTASFTATDAEDLIGSAALDADVTFDAYLDATRQGNVAGAVMTLEGTLHLTGAASLTLAGIDLHLRGTTTLVMEDNTALLGPGTLAFTGPLDQNLILKDVPAGPGRARIEQMTVRKAAGARVEIIGETTTALQIDRALTLAQGTLVLGEASELILANEVSVTLQEGAFARNATYSGGHLRFPDVQEAGTMGVDLLAGRDGIDLHYMGSTNRVVGLEWPTDPPLAIRTVTVALDDSAPLGTQVALRPMETFRATRQVHLAGGILALDGALALPAFDNTTLLIDLPEASLISNTTTLGTLRFEGAGQARVLLDTGTETTPQGADLSRLAVEVELHGQAGGLLFDATGAGDGVASLTLGRLTILDTPAFNGVSVEDGLATFEVLDSFTQQAGLFRLTGVPAAATVPQQQMHVGGSLLVGGGQFGAGGAAISVSGDVQVGSPSSMAFLDGQEETFTLMVDGAFTVFADRDPASNDPADRNRFYLAGGTAFLHGDYDFQGTGDRWDERLSSSTASPPSEYGLYGTVAFVGERPQRVHHRPGAEAAFNHVTLDNQTSIQLVSNLRLNARGRLTLQQGFIDAGPFNVVLLHPEAEGPLIGRTIPPPGTGAVEVASLRSFVRGTVERVMHEAAPGTNVDFPASFFFPVGGPNDARNGRSLLRPLMMQFPETLDASAVARVTYRPDLYAEDFSFPGEVLVVPDVRNTTLTLDVIGDMFWHVELDTLPPFKPNIRLGATGLPNVFDISKLRLIQWDCIRDAAGTIRGGARPRLAGIYPINPSPPELGSVVVNDFINGVATITQRDVTLQPCQIFGIASNFVINPITLYIVEPLARVQFVHNAPGLEPVDLYIDDDLVLDDFAYQGITPFIPIPARTYRYDLVTGTAPDNATPLLTTEVFTPPDNYILTLFSMQQDSLFTRTISSIRPFVETPGQAEFFVIHDSDDAPPLAIKLVDNTPAHDLVRVLAPRLKPGETTNYFTVPRGVHFLEVTNAALGTLFGVFRLDLTRLEERTLTLLISGRLEDNTFTLIGFDVRGDILTPDVVTSTTAATDVPTTFTLHGSYPNPFTQSTTIRFDLPEAARVTVEVVDILGRTVRTLPAQRREAGADQSLTLDASGLASGLYLYRVVARTLLGTHTRTGRMTHIK